MPESTISHISTDADYFDLKKAFDSVAHPKLLIKLPAYGINGNLYTWISDFLHNRLQVVKMNNTYSHTIKVTSGVPQGSVLGPNLCIFMTSVAYLMTLM